MVIVYTITGQCSRRGKTRDRPALSALRSEAAQNHRALSWRDFVGIGTTVSDRAFIFTLPERVLVADLGIFRIGAAVSWHAQNSCITVCTKDRRAPQGRHLCNFDAKHVTRHPIRGTKEFSHPKCETIARCVSVGHRQSGAWEAFGGAGRSRSVYIFIPEPQRAV